MNGNNVKGKRIKIDFAKPRPPRNNDRNAADRPKGCFKCGK
jgi:hypothetical protein